VGSLRNFLESREVNVKRAEMPARCGWSVTFSTEQHTCDTLARQVYNPAQSRLNKEEITVFMKWLFKIFLVRYTSYEVVNKAGF
jgi:hypothetical protein